ncbi:MAG: citrate (Si)-synthase, partial [Bacteroidia bacterium]|nr:citrate (Si)-synthase [Bacteroidia bacterium]
MSEIASLSLDGKTYELPVVVGSENEKAIDIQNLRAQTEFITLDSGFKNSGATSSKITFLDGEAGILRYRGYPIEQLAEKSSFIEVAYLLIFGNLPSKIELENFANAITRHTLIHEDMKRFYEAYPAKAHPMGVVASITCSLSTFYPDSLNANPKKEAVELTITRMLAKFSTIAAWAYKNSVGHPGIYPRNSYN